MKKSVLLGVSALALAIAMPASAETVKTETGNTVKVEGPNTYTKADDARVADKIDSEKVEKNLEQAGNSVEEAAEDVGDAINEAYRDMRDYFRGEQGPQDIRNVEIAASQTASGMIGQPVKDVSGKKIGSVHDIIIDRDGAARMVVVSDGGILGLGDKLAAFDYDVIINRDKNGDVISTLSEEAIDKVAEFSYDTKKAGDKVRVMPSGGISVKEVLDADLLSPDNETVATVDNLVFRGGEASMLIVTFNKVLGLGGEKAVMTYDDIALVESGKDKKEVDFRLTAQQAARFESFKDTASN